MAQPSIVFQMARARLGLDMDASRIIRDAVKRVTELRESASHATVLADAISAVKGFQARRFAGAYIDLLCSKQYQAAARFFLEELYSDQDFSQRDAQFARIAGALERLFPEQVVQTAVSLAQLHCLTEELDYAMAINWVSNADLPEVTRYVTAWRAVGRQSDRMSQLDMVIVIGQELDRLTRTRGLRTMLRMMRGPANLAGLGSLQQFLERGFDTFSAMARQGDGTRYFLDTVQSRESGLIDQLFHADTVACETEMARILGQPR